MDAALVRQTAAECTMHLDKLGGADWSHRIPGMDWTVAQTVAHISEALVWYAADLSAGSTELSVLELTVKHGSTHADLVRAITAYSGMLASVLEASPPDARGWHPLGMPDSSGFAAMACDEMLVHTYDAALGLDCEFTPSPELAEATLRRLFPWAPADVEPWDGLKWANGRVELGGLKRLEGWRWHCAPVSEWDGRTGSP
ncbi:MAG: maleylpyruvate isomerase N-terminal domain-containing protein [Acidimicrobiales bacterium]